MAEAAAARLTVNVVEINPHAPRPFAFTETALCLRDSIERAGFRSNLYVNKADPDSLSVILGAVPPLLGPLEQLDPRKTIVFNLEQLASASSLAGASYREWLRKWLVVDYHSANVEHLRRSNGPQQDALELPLVPGRSVLFRPELPMQQSVDVLFFGTLSERRAAVLRELERAGLTVEVVSGAYADELTPAIRRARMVLHVHFYETGLFPVTRILQPVVNAVPIVCETSAIASRSDWTRSGIVFAPYGQLVAACAALLRSQPERQQRAQRSLAFASELDFATPFGLLLEAVAKRLEPVTPVAQASTAPDPPAPSADDEEPLSDAQIEALLAAEPGVLPPESHLPPTPLKLVERQLGQGRYGLWAVWLLLLFSLYTIWQAMR